MSGSAQVDLETDRLLSVRVNREPFTLHVRFGDAGLTGWTATMVANHPLGPGGSLGRSQRYSPLFCGSSRFPLRVANRRRISCRTSLWS